MEINNHENNEDVKFNRPKFIQNEWIPLEKLKPPQNALVLVSVHNFKESVFMSHVEIAFRMGNEWFDSGDDSKIEWKSSYVTHWQPLPDSMIIERRK